VGNGYDVLPYNIDSLKELLRQNSSKAVVDGKLHTIYFEEYFREIGAATIVVEREYVDRDYLEDYASYYVKCFASYERRCTRLHFFSRAISKCDFDELLKTNGASLNGSQLQQDYLGFIVVKPLPKTLIGRTCLKTYPFSGRRHYPIVRSYQANLFGFPIRVETLAFQEQDSDVAACATSALWSVFQGTGKLFQHRIPSPAEITKAATEAEPSQSRSMPATEGLSPTQMARAIRVIGLEPFYVGAGDADVIKTTAYAYLRGRVPLILGLALFDGAPRQHQRLKGKHAVAVTGFSLGHATAAPHGKTGFLLEASRIDKLYAHDDQVGPFARMEFDGTMEDFEVAGNPIRSWSLKTSWKRSDGALGMRAIPTMFLIPLYHKIRIPYESAERIVRTFDAILTHTGKTVLGGQRFTWDIYLSLGSDAKSEIISEGSLLGEPRQIFLTTPLPRFLWRARARLGSQVAFDLFFDATDIEQGRLLVHILEYISQVSDAARLAANDSQVQDETRADPVHNVFEWFRSHT
jgi:hypothetical protein